MPPRPKGRQQVRIVHLFGKAYGVQRVPAEELGGNIGQTSPALQRIRIGKHLPAGQAADTLLHEVIEVINWELGLDLKEEQIRPMASVLYGALRDNPALCAELLGA